MKGTQKSLTTVVVESGQADQANPSTHGSRRESWATPRSGKTTDENPDTWALRQAKGDVATMPLGAQVKAWATPRAEDSESAGMRHGLGIADALTAQTRHWPTPMGQAQGATGNIAGNSDFIRKVEMIEGMRETVNGAKTGAAKLNPAWVCCLMGVPVNWVRPN